MLNQTRVTTETIGIQSVEVRERFNVRLTFTDGTQRELDLEPYLRGPIFEPIRSDIQVFRQVSVDPEWHCLTWPNGADIDPDALYYDGPPPWAETDVDGAPLPPPSTPK